MTDAAKKAKRKYDEKRQIKNVSFNTNNEHDIKLLDCANNVQPNFSEWVKAKLNEELDK